MEDVGLSWTRAARREGLSTAVLGALTGLGAGLAGVRLCGGGLELGQAGEAVGDGVQLEPELVAGPAEIAQLAASTDRLDPAKDFLDPLAPALAVLVARVPGVVRRSMALRRSRSFWATCGVAPKARARQTKSRVS